MNTEKYAIVLDLDETIGHFSQIYVFWSILKNYINNNNLDWKNILFILFDTFPSIFRTDIFDIFKFIVKKKQNNICNYVCIYTNNNGPYFWVEYIKLYINYKLNYNLFDRIIRAFKIDNKIIEHNRSSFDKSHKDLLNCTKLPKNTKFCFIDDIYHPYMLNDNIDYLKIKPYVHHISYINIIDLFYNNNKEIFINNNKNKDDFIKLFNKYVEEDIYLNIEKSSIEKNIDILVSDKIHKFINKFLEKKKRNLNIKTKTKTKTKAKTRKNIN